jgi:hypothetical protein
MFYVNAGILFYIAFVVNNHLQFCKIKGIAFEFIKRYTQTMNIALRGLLKRRVKPDETA